VEIACTNELCTEFGIVKTILGPLGPHDILCGTCLGPVEAVPPPDEGPSEPVQGPEGEADG
jgi:hypothetical protein